MNMTYEEKVAMRQELKTKIAALDKEIAEIEKEQIRNDTNIALQALKDVDEKYHICIDVYAEGDTTFTLLEVIDMLTLEFRKVGVI